MSLGSAIEWGDVGQVIWASLLAGVGVSFAFSLAILGATRAIDLRRGGHSGAASVYIVVMVLGLLATVAALIFGVVVMTAKD